MSQLEQLSRIFKNAGGVPYAGFLVEITEAKSGAKARLYTSAGTLESDSGVTYTNALGIMNVHISGDRVYTLSLYHPESKALVDTFHETSPGTNQANPPNAAAAGTGSNTLRGREILTASRIYYVRKDGSDNNTGLTDTTAGAFLTIGKAMSQVANLDCGGLPGVGATIKMADGVYEEAIVCASLIGGVKDASGNILANIVGNLAQPQNVIIYPPAGTIACVLSQEFSVWYIRGITTNATRAVYSYLVYNFSVIILDKFHLILNGGVALKTRTGGRIQAWSGSTVRITGSCNAIAYASGQSSIALQVQFEFVGNSNMSYAFLLAEYLSYIDFYNYGIVGTGTCTGQRYDVSYGSVISTYESGETAVPGSLPGTATLQGIYS